MHISHLTLIKAKVFDLKVETKKLSNSSLDSFDGNRRGTYFAIILPGTAILKVCDLPFPVGS
jgi:hypothetical protein